MEDVVACAQIDRFSVPLDRAYHPRDHTWARIEGDLVRVGMDELSAETTGDLAQLFLVGPGTVISHGDEMGSLEAQKFVGPLRAPICGTVEAVNERVVSEPSLVNRDPMGEGWLMLLRPGDDWESDMAHMVRGDDVTAWFTAVLAEYRRQGSVAE